MIKLIDMDMPALFTVLVSHFLDSQRVSGRDYLKSHEAGCIYALYLIARKTGMSIEQWNEIADKAKDWTFNDSINLELLLKDIDLNFGGGKL